MTHLKADHAVAFVCGGIFVDVNRQPHVIVDVLLADLYTDINDTSIWMQKKAIAFKTR